MYLMTWSGLSWGIIYRQQQRMNRWPLFLVYNLIELKVLT